MVQLFMKYADVLKKECNRCVKSHRRCPGYKDDTALFFRNYTPPKATYKTTICWWAPEVPDEKLEEAALGIFLAEFVLESRDRLQSRGFLDGMESLLTSISPDSSLATAARALVLASVGKRTGRESLAERAQWQYGQLLRSFTQSLSEETTVVSIESLYTAVLLGIYEIIVSSDSSPTQHKAHVQGVCAILKGGVKPFDLKKGVRVYSLGNPLVLRTPVAAEHAGMGVLCAPVTQGCLQNLDAILIKFHPFKERALMLLEDPSTPIQTLSQLQDEASELDTQLSNWNLQKHCYWAPQVYGRVRNAAAETPGTAFVAEGRVDKYFDFYVAAVWNTWRKAQLTQVDITLRLAKLLGPEESIPGYQERARDLVADMKASIPFCLAENLDEYLRLAATGSPDIPPNRPVGGLLLLHPLYTAAACPAVPLADRKYFINTLFWIGDYMGIGQATLLAKALASRPDSVEKTQAPQLPYMDLSDGHVLIWAGMMLEPAAAAAVETSEALNR